MIPAYINRLRIYVNVTNIHIFNLMFRNEVPVLSIFNIYFIS